jgi:hypothetical protein
MMTLIGTLIEEMRLAVLEIWQSLGFEGSSGTAAAVVPALVLGIALNVAALSVVDRVRAGGHAGCQKAGLRSVAQTEFVMVRAVVTSTLKKICEGQRGLCAARQWLLDWQAGGARSEISYGWRARVSAKGVALSIAVELPERLSPCSRAMESMA